VAEHLYVEALARDEQLHLLALIAAGLGAEGLEDYEPPPVRVADWLTPPPTAADRQARVAEWIALTGGEVG